MKLGVEEEFFLINPSTMFLYPAAPRIGLSLVLKKKKFIDDFSMEFPHSPSALRYPFSIVELKTSPKKDIDSLKDEIVHNRGFLRDVCRKNGLQVLASGSHPFCHPLVHGDANCCALHIHVSGVSLKRTYSALRFFTGPLIALSANSPFLGGRKFYYCSRLAYSPFVGTRDFSIKKDLGTVESRIFDTQITSQRTVSLAALIAIIADTASSIDNHFWEVSKDNIIQERDLSIRHGLSPSHLKEKFERVSILNRGLDLTEHVNLLFNKDPGSIWQLRIVENFGFSSLLFSLFESFEKDELRIIKGREVGVQWDIPSFQSIPKEMPFILMYLPFIIHTKLKTYQRKLPREIVRWFYELF